jgi:hypothetical protein
MEVQFAKSSNRFGVDFPAAQELPSQHKDLRVLPAKESQWTAGTGDAGELRPMLIWDSKWLGRSVDGIFYDNLDGWYWVSPFAILAWFTGESSSWQNPTAPFFQKKSCDLIQTFPKKQSSWQEAYQKWFNLIDGGSASTNDMSRASPCGRS